jgi:outer membrane protein
MSRKQIIFIVAVSLALSAASVRTALGQAASATVPVGSKIAVVSMQDAIANCNECQKDFEALQQKYAPKSVELQTLAAEIKKLQDDYQKTADKLSPEEQSSRARTIDSKQKLLQRQQDDAQSDYQRETQEVVNRIGGKMIAVLEKYAQTNGYMMVIDVSNPQTSPVLWASKGTNITKELIDAYNVQSGVAAPAPAAPNPAASTPPRPNAPTPKNP